MKTQTHSQIALCRSISFLALMLFPFFLHAQISGWHWVNPLPQGNVIHQVIYYDQQTGYAVGNYGSILKTSDGGVQWESLFSPTDVELFSVAAPARGEIVVVGKNTCYKSKDDGIHWEAIGNAQMDTTFLTGVIFTDADTGFISGFWGMMFKTTDGGATWSGMKINAYNIYPVELVQFTDHQTGYANYMFGSYYKTTDGGASWQMHGTGMQYDINAIKFINNDTGFVATYGALLRTVNGGDSWETVQPPERIKDFAFNSRQTGFAVTDEGLVLKTTDTGMHWLVTDTLPIPLNTIAFCSGQSGCVAGEAGQVYSTSDGGSTWQCRSSGPTENLNTISFPTAETGFAGGDGVILKSSDGGNSWAVIDSMPQKKVEFIRFFSPLDGNAVIMSQNDFSVHFATTSDGGINWHDTPVATNYYVAPPGVSMPDVNTCYIAGINQDPQVCLYKTTDRGHTWLPVAFPFGIYHSDFRVFFTSADTGFIAENDFNGALTYKTVNGGQTWQTQTLNSLASYVESIFFVNSLTGYIGGGARNSLGSYGACLLRTLDGGNSWHTMLYRDTMPQWTFNDVCFINPAIGYIAGYQFDGKFRGLILKTEDGGTTWTPQLHKTSNMLRSIAVIDENTGFVAGDYGTILMTNTRGDFLSVPQCPGTNKPVVLSYPNPCSDFLRLSITPAITGKYTIEVFSTLGNKVFHRSSNEIPMEGSFMLVDTRDFKEGLYIYRLVSGNRTVSGKFIKSN
ncbi:MAG: YCF48-related protein [Bacteroidota bacterium]